MNKDQTIKVQRPINSSDGKNVWLIYGRKRIHMSYLYEADVPEAVMTAMGEDYKAYFSGVHGPAGWAIGPRVPSEDW